MYTYLWQAKNREGKETARRVKAETAQEARTMVQEARKALLVPSPLGRGLG